MRLPFTNLVDISQARALEFESATPVGQATATQLLVILHEKGGGDFLATTARTLNESGKQQTFVSLTAPQLAGWSQDADGVLDLRRVEEIRIGWGGYLGQQGEDVAFDLAPPRLVMVSGE